MINSRKIKIHTKYKSGMPTSTKIPVIRLEGKWLKKLGFNEGEMINIEQKKYKLIITVEKDNL
ncbi:type I toxin-antitoxin system SymE family toxin [Flavobacterium sp. N1736]|uniref:type I toxin-antitoxin system SymE family toxin n=1 Tax=Flavobacterium sp. N1736 TaxID=2986823 RepID=UPI0022255C66|nr:type I toxin-antitoxin system SymE family toxin [Flavobacterium sp. N1736]